MRKQKRHHRRAATKLAAIMRDAGIQRAKPRRAISIAVPAGTVVNMIASNPHAYRINYLRAKAQ